MKVPLLTRRLVENAPPAEKSPYYIMEDGGRGAVLGFGARIHRGRTRQWIARYSHQLYTIARTDLMDVQEARRRARAWLLEKTTGQPRPGEADAQGAGSNGGPADPPVPVRTVGELFARYAEDQFGDLRESTRQSYRRTWGTYLEHRFASLRLDELAGEHIWKMRREMEATPTTFNHARQLLRSCLQHGITLEWLPQGGNKVDLVPKAKVEKRQRKLYFIPEEYQRFGDALRRAEHERRIHYPGLVAVWILLTTGCRPSEVLRAKRSWAVLDDENPRIEVKQHKGQRKGKVSRARILWLHPAVVEMLRRIEYPPGNPWLIPGRKPGKPLSDLHHMWALLAEMAGIEGSSPYTARHSYRSEAAEAKIQTERVQVLMGHRPGSKVTDSTYLHTHERQRIAAARQMEEHLGRLVGLVEPGKEEGHASS